MNASNLKKALREHASPERKKSNEWFFKTGKGEYGEHDKFLGVKNPDIRLVAKKFHDLNLLEIQKVINSPYNEERLCGLIVLVEKFKKGSDKERELIYKFYIKNLRQVNNWNLVDIATPHIAGEYLVVHKNELNILDKLSSSNFHWHRRVSILATFSFIRRGDLALIFKYAKKLLKDKEDLMHKAIGWMLREAWKKDSKQTEEFLIKNYNKLPRTTLRYAIERMEEKKRKSFLAGAF